MTQREKLKKKKKNKKQKTKNKKQIQKRKKNYLTSLAPLPARPPPPNIVKL